MGENPQRMMPPDDLGALRLPRKQEVSENILQLSKLAADLHVNNVVAQRAPTMCGAEAGGRRRIAIAAGIP